jgi:hypothetical protein
MMVLFVFRGSSPSRWILVFRPLAEKGFLLMRNELPRSKLRGITKAVVVWDGVSDNLFLDLAV